MPIIKINNHKAAQEGGEKGAQKAVTDVCVRLTAQAKSLAPVDTALLKNSLTWKTNKAKGTGIGNITENPKDFEGFVGTDVQYAIYQEFGTRYMKAQPFMKPAMNIVKGKAKNIIIKAANDEMGKKLKRIQ